jgi:diguanylate cyclase (GGDEF)-like protein/PAS domain S-box-containing protein
VIAARRLALAMSVAALACLASPAGADLPIRVGVYDNPPKVELRPGATPSGFWPELTRVIAAREGLGVIWVPGTWEQNLARLEAGEIDVLVDVGVTPARQARFLVGDEPVHVSWSRVYVARGTAIETIPDLAGRRIGGLERSLNLEGPDGLRQLLDDFGIRAEIVTYPSFPALFEALASGRVDAGVANRDFGNRMQSEFGVAPTPILFQPAELRYAFPRGATRTPALASAFDRQLRSLKADPGSALFALQGQWLGLEETRRETMLPPWLRGVLLALGGAVLLLGAGAAAVEARVRARTRALRRQEAETRRRGEMLVDSQRIARVGSWRWHVATDVLEWSAETYRIAGVTAADFDPTPQAFLDLVHPDDRVRVERDQQAVARGEGASELEFRLMRPDGTARHVHTRSETRRGLGGELVVDGTVQDVTEQRETEAWLDEYAALVEGSDDFCAIIDAEYRYHLVNGAYARAMGQAREAILGARVPDVVGRTLFEAAIRPGLDRCLAGEALTLEAERAYPATGTRQLLVRYHPVVPRADARPLAGVVITDITEFKRLEDELHEHRRLADMAGRMARLGAWSIDRASGRVTWSDVTCEIHGLPHGHVPVLDEAIGFFVPAHRERVRKRVEACLEHAASYQDELQIIDAKGATRWVRTIGEPRRDHEGCILGAQGAVQDITAEKDADLELERLNARLANILESITDAFLTVDREWRFRYVNAEAGRIMGYAPEAMIGCNAWDLFPAARATVFEREFHRAMDERVPVSLEEYYEPFGLWLDIRVYPTEEGLVLYFRDVTERRQMTEQLRAHEARLRESRDELAAALDARQALINSLPAHIALLDPEGNVVDVNDQWREYGEARSQADPGFGIGRNYPAVCDAADGDCATDAARVAAGLRALLDGSQSSFAHEYPCHGPDEARWFRVMANALGAGDPQRPRSGVVVMHVDITERKLAEAELERLAYRDPLTELLSRNGFVRLLGERLGRTGWQPEALVVMLNVRNQRDVNDAHGYAVGDQVLREVGRRLAAFVPGDGLVGRPGGDEFVVFLPGRAGDDPAGLRDALTETFRHPIDVGEVSMSAGAHFGYTRLGGQPRPEEELLREAAVALFKGRRAGVAGRCHAYTRALDREVRGRVELTRDLQRALDNEEFELHFQPKVRLDTGELVAAEALLRWRHPEHGLQSPAGFIPVAEQSQLIGPIGDWVLREACRQLHEWQSANLSVVRVAVNVSLIQFTVGDFAANVQDALDAYAVAPEHLSLEVTESVFEQESDALHRQLEQLRMLGVHLSLDDFGTGYSSLRYLQRYPFHEIKIDQSFVRNLLDNEYDHRIVKMVLGLAGALEAEPIAEGVETAAMRDALAAMGCPFAQGYYFSMPLESEDFRWLLERRSPLPLAVDATS